MHDATDDDPVVSRPIINEVVADNMAARFAETLGPHPFADFRSRGQQITSALNLVDLFERCPQVVSCDVFNNLPKVGFRFRGVIRNRH
jgi:hypothetical protein